MHIDIDGPACGSEQEDGAIVVANQMADLMLSVVSDTLDHPELWNILPDLVSGHPWIIQILQHRLATSSGTIAIFTQVLLALCLAVRGEAEAALADLAPLAADYSQSPLVQGARFHVQGLLDPNNRKYRLDERFCTTPFVQLDVLENSAHLCCASWLGTSIGDLSVVDWKDVWNSNAAQSIRESIQDGSFRHCNKGACPSIQAGTLPTRQEQGDESQYWHAILESATTVVDASPDIVNLAYDRTCNLSCPSCRGDRFAADKATRDRYEAMQERAILPMLKNAKLVFITGSGDPFASKNFRQLMTDLSAAEYPDLRFQIMTNGMLLNAHEWARFPALHRRVQMLKISIDAATGPTHERLRRGARWPTMLENMKFAGTLHADGHVENYELVFVVQTENFREMGDAVDLAKTMGASGIFFARMTNWGTFTPHEYREKAVFLSHHPEHAAFLEHMQDARLRDPIVLLGDLQPFVDDEVVSRQFVR